MSTNEPSGWGPPPSYPPPSYPPPAYPPSSYPPPSDGGWAQPPPPPPTGGSARTGPLALQPMGVGEILDGAIKLFRANFKAIALVALIVSGPFQLIVAVLARGQNGGQGLFDMLSDPSLTDPSTTTDPFANLGPQLAVLSTTLLNAIVISPVVAGAVAKAVATSYLGGQLTAGEAIKASLRRAWPLIAAAFLVHLTEGVGLLGCCIGALFVMPLWVAVSPAIVVEELGPLRGMGRSWRLCTSRYWQVLGIALLSGVITYTLSAIIGGVPGILAAIIGYRWGFPLLAVGGIATAIFVAPLSSIVATLVYFDLRIRREGFDLQVMAADMARPGTP